MKITGGAKKTVDSEREVLKVIRDDTGNISSVVRSPDALRKAFEEGYQAGIKHLEKAAAEAADKHADHVLKAATPQVYESGWRDGFKAGFENARGVKPQLAPLDAARLRQRSARTTRSRSEAH